MPAPVPPNFPTEGGPPPIPQGPNDGQPLPPGKSVNVLLWTLGGVVALMVLVTTMCGVGSYYMLRKAKNAGVDTTLMEKNPGYSLAKMAISINPEYEIVSSDDAAGKVTVREKTTGKVVTMTFDPVKKVMVVTDENGKQVTMSASGEGDKSSLTVESGDGKMKFGAATNNQMPAWVPVYPGSSPQGTFSASNKDGEQNGFGFKTSDEPAKVVEYYQTELKDAGFSIHLSSNTAQGGMVIAEDGGKNKTITVTANRSGGTTDVSVMAIEKKK